MTNSPTFEIEQQAIKNHGPIVAGIDEAGRGPWAGPCCGSGSYSGPKITTQMA